MLHKFGPVVQWQDTILIKSTRKFDSFRAHNFYKMIDKKQKLQDLIDKRDYYKNKLVDLYKNFRGVKHENSLSELRYSQIKVYEDFVNSYTSEIEALKKELESR